MRRSDIKKMLRERADRAVINDLSDKIIESVDKSAQINSVCDSKEHSLAANGRKEIGTGAQTPSRKVGFLEKLKARGSVYAAGIAAVCMCLVICVAVFRFAMPPGDVTTDTPNFGTAKAGSVFSHQLFALGNLISLGGGGETAYSANGGVTPLSSLKYQNPISNKDSENDGEGEYLGDETYRQIAEDANYYMLTGMAFLRDEKMTFECTENNNSQYSQYSYMLRVSYIDEQLYSAEYTIYFNEKVKGNETKIDGVAIINGSSYSVYGESGKEGDEVEMELTVKLSESSYISVCTDTEINENEYEYQFVKDGALVKGIKMEFETEGGLSEWEIVVTENDREEGYSFEFKNDMIECEYEGYEYEAKMEIYAEVDYYLYTFEGGYTVKLPRDSSLSPSAHIEAGF